MNLFLILVLALVAASVLALLHAVKSAPEGVETEEGFSFAPVARRALRRRRRAALVHRSALSSS